MQNPNLTAQTATLWPSGDCSSCNFRHPEHLVLQTVPALEFDRGKPQICISSGGNWNPFCSSRSSHHWKQGSLSSYKRWSLSNVTLWLWHHSELGNQSSSGNSPWKTIPFKCSSVQTLSPAVPSQSPFVNQTSKTRVPTAVFKVLSTVTHSQLSTTFPCWEHFTTRGEEWLREDSGHCCWKPPVSSLLTRKGWVQSLESLLTVEFCHTPTALGLME